MVKLQKMARPNSLSQHSEEWTENLLVEYEAQGYDSAKVVDKFWTRYRKDDIKVSLEKETYGKCH